MGLRYHRLFNVGPLHVTASKSGISCGAGIKGARITERADGGVQTTVSAPGTGLGSITTGARKGKRPRSAPQYRFPGRGGQPPHGREHDMNDHSRGEHRCGGRGRPRVTDALAPIGDVTRRHEGGGRATEGTSGGGRRGTAGHGTPILLSDSRVSAVPVHDDGEPLVELDESFGTPRGLVRVSLARRLLLARDRLPHGVGLRVVEGYRTAADQRRIVGSYSAELRSARPGIGAEELERLTSRFVAPVEVAPHVAGAAVDLTLVDRDGRELDLGTPVDATPEQSDGACYLDAPQVTGQARARRALLAQVLESTGLINYPTEWWHWSYGDRYWALLTGASGALYGPIAADWVVA